MKMKKYLGMIYIATVIGITALAQAQAADKAVRAPSDRFEASLFGSYSSDHNAGAGVGLSYFFNEVVGVSADVQGASRTGLFDFEHLNISGSVVFRYPIDAIRLTPYALVGADYNRGRIHPVDGKADEFNAHAGLGAAFALTKHVSIFGEGRILLFDAYERTYSARAGIRFGF
jgi:opacity protein-like surface antigen